MKEVVFSIKMAHCNQNVIYRRRELFKAGNNERRTRDVHKDGHGQLLFHDYEQNIKYIYLIQNNALILKL